MSTERWIDIPEEVRDIYRLWRPTPLYRPPPGKGAQDPCQDLLQVRGRKPCRQPQAQYCVPQAYYNMKEGIERLATETGAGQWGSALSWPPASSAEVHIYMVRSSFDSSPTKERHARLGRRMFRQPSDKTIMAERSWPRCGHAWIAGHRHLRGGGDAATTAIPIRPGSVLNHVLIHQSVEAWS